MHGCTKGKDPLAEKMKIAFLMQESRMGGIEYNSVHLAEKINREKFEVVFLCPGEGKLPGLLREKKIPFRLYQRPPFFSTSLRVGKRHIFNPFATAYNFICFFIMGVRQKKGTSYVEDSVSKAHARASELQKQVCVVLF